MNGAGKVVSGLQAKEGGDKRRRRGSVGVSRSEELLEAAEREPSRGGCTFAGGEKDIYNSRLSG